MKLLAVETATSRLSVALLEGARIMARADQDAPGKHARHLVPTIDHLLTSSRLALPDLEGLAVSIGPGSFTGLRVGLATMMGFRMVTGLPLATVPTLEAMAWNLRGVDRPLCPVLRARTGEVYWAIYRWSQDGALEQIVPERVGSLEAMLDSLEWPVLIFGEGWQANREEFHRLLTTVQREVEEAPQEATAASAVSVGLAALNRLARGEVAGQGLSPRYVQRSEAELMLERRFASRG